jgi:hypothetical protein
MDDGGGEWQQVAPRRGARVEPPLDAAPVGAIDAERLFAHFQRVQRDGSDGSFVSVYVLPAGPGARAPPAATLKSVSEALRALREGGHRHRQFSLAGQAERRLGIACGVRVHVPGSDKAAVVCCAVPGGEGRYGRRDAIFINLRAAEARRPEALFERGPPRRLRLPPPHVSILCSRADRGDEPDTLLTHLTYTWRDEKTHHIGVEHVGHDTVYGPAGIAPRTLRLLANLARDGRGGADPRMPARAVVASEYVRWMEAEAEAAEDDASEGGGQFISRAAPREGGLIDAAFEAFCLSAPPEVHARLYAPEADGRELLVLDCVDPDFPYAVYVSPDAHLLGDCFLPQEVRASAGSGGRYTEGFEERLKVKYGFLEGVVDLTLEGARPDDAYPRLVGVGGGGGASRASGLLAAGMLVAVCAAGAVTGGLAEGSRSL